MSKLSDSAVAWLDTFWAGETRCDPADFDNNTVAVAERSETDGSEYVQLFRRKQHLQITCSASMLKVAVDAIRGQAPDTAFDVLFLGPALAGRVDRIIGPAYLGYLDVIGPGTDDSNVRQLGGDDQQALDALRRGVTALDWEYSGLAPDQPIAGYFAGGALVSAAGYEVWGDHIAHIGVVTRPDVRGAGHGCACVRAITRHATGRGLIAQYRTLYENVPAMAIGRFLGFEDYAATIYVRATAT